MKFKALTFLIVLALLGTLVACAGQPVAEQPTAEEPAAQEEMTAEQPAAEGEMAEEEMATEEPAAEDMAPAADKVFKIGVLGPFTGPSARTGEEFKIAAEMALENINYQVGDYTIEPVWVDLMTAAAVKLPDWVFLMTAFAVKDPVRVVTPLLARTALAVNVVPIVAW